MSDLIKQIQEVAGNVQNYRVDAQKTEQRSLSNERLSAKNDARVQDLREKFLAAESGAASLRDGWEARMLAAEDSIAQQGKELNALRAQLAHFEGRDKGRREATGSHASVPGPKDDGKTTREMLALAGKVVGVIVALVTLVGFLARAMLER